MATPTSYGFEIELDSNAQWLSAADEIKLPRESTQLLKLNSMAWRASALQHVSSIHPPRRRRNYKALLISSHLPSCRTTWESGIRGSRPKSLRTKRLPLLMRACIPTAPCYFPVTTCHLRLLKLGTEACRSRMHLSGRWSPLTS